MFDGQPLIDEAFPGVRGDPWAWDMSFFEGEEGDDSEPSDFTGLDCAAILRWKGADDLEVTVDQTDKASGVLGFSLTAEETATLPLGRIVRLYVAAGEETILISAVHVIEGKNQP